MFSWLLEFDKKAFLYLNGIHSPEWDGLMMWITGNTVWIPFYVFILFMVVYRERPYRFIFTILFVVVTVFFCDQLSTLIKSLVERPRPTHNPEIADLVHVVNNYRGGPYGCVSSHAANVFGVAVFLSNQFKHYRWSLALLGWAAIVSYSRIYLGVHYPLDIICGAVLGALIGIQCYVFKIWTAVYAEKYIEDRKAKRRSNERVKKSEKDKYEQIIKNM